MGIIGCGWEGRKEDVLFCKKEPKNFFDLGGTRQMGARGVVKIFAGFF
jgi:hypothetical protein